MRNQTQTIDSKWAARLGREIFYFETKAGGSCYKQLITYHGVFVGIQGGSFPPIRPNLKPKTMKSDLIQKTLNNVEIRGLIAMFNEFYTDYLIQQGQLEEGQKTDHGFFYSSDWLHSEDVANGTPIYFEGYKISCLAKRENGDLTYMILEDENENEFLCEFNCYSGQWYILETELSGKTF